MNPPAMTTTDTSACRVLRRFGALATVAIVMASCGGVQRDVQVPGAAPLMAPAALTDAEHFTTVTEVATVDAVTSVASPLADQATTTTTVPAPPVTTVPGPPTQQGSEVLVVVPAITGWAAFDVHLTTILDAGSTAVSATVLRDGDVVHEVALGERAPSGDAVEVGDRYRVASISKVVTAITTLRLVEQGLIGLDDPVGARLAARVGVASPASGVDQITVRHLLTHRSGIAQYENLMFRRQVESCEQAGASGLSRALERAPGTKLRYSNLNFCLLGLLIEDVTGQPYDDVARAELLSPLGVDGMRLAGTFDARDDEVEHRSDEGRNYMEVLGAAGSWLASPTEVATIIDSLDLATPGWKPLGPDMVAEMRRATEDPPLTAEEAATTSSTLEPPSPPTRGYGMGLMIFGADSFGHTGTLESTHAMTARQGDGITWAIAVSGDHPSSTTDLADLVAEALRYAGEG